MDQNRKGMLPEESDRVASRGLFVLGEGMDVQVFTAVEGMDSREISRLTGKEHRNVCRDIDAMLAGLEGVCSDRSTPPEEEYHRGDRTQYKYLKPSTVDAFMDLGKTGDPRGALRAKFESTYRNEQNGQVYRCYVLPKRECILLASTYDIVLSAKIIDRWLELEDKAITQAVPAKQLSRMEILRLAMEAEEKVQALETQCAIDAPKVAAQDLLAGADGLFGIREAGKQVDMGQKEFIAFLENSRPKIMYRVAGGGLTPYQVWIDRGYFAVTTGTAVHGEAAHAWRQPKFTAKGIAWIAEKIGMQRRDAA